SALVLLLLREESLRDPPVAAAHVGGPEPVGRDRGALALDERADHRGVGLHLDGRDRRERPRTAATTPARGEHSRDPHAGPRAGRAKRVAPRDRLFQPVLIGVHCVQSITCSAGVGVWKWSSSVAACASHAGTSTSLSRTHARRRRTSAAGMPASRSAGSRGSFAARIRAIRPTASTLIHGASLPRTSSTARDSKSPSTTPTRAARPSLPSR